MGRPATWGRSPVGGAGHTTCYLRGSQAGKKVGRWFPAGRFFGTTASLKPSSQAGWDPELSSSLQQGISTLKVALEPPEHLLKGTAGLHPNS